jgi:hypothetical protein
MKYQFYLYFVAFITLSCSSKDAKMQSAEDKDSASKIYYNPISADKVVKEDQVAKMSFDKLEHDFGTINEGDVVQHVFKFKNSGKAPLVITNASGTCGCTVPEWPKEPIAPGKSGEIKVSFNSLGKSGKEEKEVFVLANTIPNKTTLQIKSMVLSKQK